MNKEKMKSTMKSSEIDDWVDRKFVRPFAYVWALFFAKLNISPNAVTILSMFVGAIGALFFISGCFYYCGINGLIANIIGILLLIYADVLDCTDGQLARMTSKTSRLGRILDGLAGAVWYIPLYIVLIIRIYHFHDIEFGWFGIENTHTNIVILTILVTILANISGFICCEGQQRVADYYIQVHLFFLKGEKGSELENSVRLQKQYDDTPWNGNRLWKLFLKSYIQYTKLQEKRTPEFQKLKAFLSEKYGTVDKFPKEIRQQIHDTSLRLMPLNGLMTFNFRTAFLILFCIADLPLEYLLFESIVMTLMCNYIVYRHESFCRNIYKELNTLSYSD